METRLIGYEHAAKITDIASWANDLIGKEVPGCPGYSVVRVIQFRFAQVSDGYDALVLVEVKEEGFEELSIKEADVVAIEEITSSVDEPA